MTPIPTEPERKPTRAITVIQPWAWLIVNGYKDVENRTRPTKFRGPIYIHAGKKHSKVEWESAWITCPDGVDIPLLDSQKLEFGALIGIVNVIDCVTSHRSKWFSGPYGFVLADVQLIDPIPMRGQLGIWRVPVI